MGAPSTYKSCTAAAGTAVVCNTSAKLRAVVIQGGSAQSTITVYDNASAASGNTICSFVVAANTSWSHDFSDGVDCLNGITFTVAGTAAVGYVYFNRE